MKQNSMLDLDKIRDIVFSGVDNGDYPDYSDAFVESAMYKDREMKEDELVELQDKHHEYMWNKLMDTEPWMKGFDL